MFASLTVLMKDNKLECSSHLRRRRKRFYNFATSTVSGEKSNVLTCHAVAKDTGLTINSVAVFSRLVSGNQYYKAFYDNSGEHTLLIKADKG